MDAFFTGGIFGKIIEFLRSIWEKFEQDHILR